MSEVRDSQVEERFGQALESIKSGTGSELQQACEWLILGWREAPVLQMLSLKKQLERLGLEQRESMLEEALISVAEKRPGPFLDIASDPSNRLWGQAVEILSMLADPSVLDLLLSLESRCEEKELPAFIRALGNFNDPRAAEALQKYLRSEEDHLFIEAVMALRRAGGNAALAHMKSALAHRNNSVAASSEILKAVIAELGG